MSGIIGVVRAATMFLLTVTAVAVSFASSAMAQMDAAQQADGQPPAEMVTPDPWPKTIEQGGVKYTIYQPQMDSWDYYRFVAHAAVSVLPAGAKEPIFGIIDLTAKTHVWRLLRTVDFRDIKIVKATFPSVPGQAAQYQEGFQQVVSNGPSTMSLDRLEAMVAITAAQKKALSVPIKNAAPQFVFARTAAILVSVDGQPVWRPVAGTSLQRVINTRALILLDDMSAKYYVHLFDGFVEAPALSGPWTVSKSAPAAAGTVAEELATEGVVDLLEGQADGQDQQKPSLKKGVPEVFVATVPTELVVTEGAPDWVPITGTMLLYVKNTSGNIFRDINSQMIYVLVTGRWFKAADFAGPWQFVAGKDLPPDFARMPDDSPKENVLASVPGTPQAEQAVIANEIPQTATVNRATAAFIPRVNGVPELKPIPDTTLMYVYNSPDPIIMVTAGQWYAVRSGVWFTATSVQGPWSIATSIPAVIYSIPPISPLYYVTYVKIYDVTPQTVVVGYTPGYLGTVVSPDGTVVFGTGYTYIPYIGESVWYAPPLTYGYAASLSWTPWTGWAMGFGFGWAMGAAFGYGGSCCWGCAPYWGAYGYPYGSAGYAYGMHGGAAAWGPGGWAATTGNVYSHWGPTTAVSRTSAGYNAWTGNAWSSKVGASYNSVTGRVSAGQRASVANAYTGGYANAARGATDNPMTGVSARGGAATYGNVYTGAQGSAKWGQVTGPGGQTASAAKVGNNVYAGHDGNVYKDTGSGWQKYDNGSWNNVQDSKATQSLQGQQQARQAGDQRSAASSWGSKDWGGGFDHSSGGGWGRYDMGGGGFDRSGSFGGGGWDRGGFGGGGGFGGHSWGGGAFGGGGFGGFRGGGFRR